MPSERQAQEHMEYNVATARQYVREGRAEKGMRYEEDAEYWENAVTEIADGLGDPAALPPLLVCHDRGDFVILDGNHRHEAFRRRGWCSAWVLIGC